LPVALWVILKYYTDIGIGYNIENKVSYVLKRNFGPCLVLVLHLSDAHAADSRCL